MNRLERVTALLLRLQAHRALRAQELADHYGVNVRTIYRDLRTLEAAGVPLATEATGKFSLAEGYRLPPVMFTREEATALLTAEKLAEQLTDASTARFTRAAMDKLRAVFRRPDRDYVEDVTPRIAVQWRHAPLCEPAAPDARQLLLAGLTQRRVVRLGYRSGHAHARTTRDVEPIGLYFNLHWHVLAYCRLRRELRDFRLDRIQELHLLAETFAPRSETLASYWAQRRAEAPPQAVVLRFSSRGRQLVRDEKHFYGWVAEHELPDGGVAMHLLLPALRYLAHWLLYFGAEVTIISPPSLRQLAADMARQALAQHARCDGAGVPEAVTLPPAPSC